MDWVYLAVGGFLLGSVLASGFYTVGYEPEARAGYTLIGLGTAIAVTTTSYVQFVVRRDTWPRVAVMIGYALVAIGLTMLVRERRRRSKADRR